MVKVLVTGSLGYIGSVLIPTLVAEDLEVGGIDSGLYRETNLEPTPLDSLTTIQDIREAEKIDFDGFSAVVHLAALSNDPLGALDPSLTHKINFRATVELAMRAKAAGVKRFVFVSTQSVYGIAEQNSRDLDEFASAKSPLTEYATTKLRAENALQEMHSKDFFCIVLRPATVFGYSPRLRSDIVFNNLLAQAFFRHEIRLKSDGKPWRPVIHVQDLSKAILLAVNLPQERLKSRTYNVGVKGGNHTVLEIAEHARALVPGSELSIGSEPTPDERSYRVGFDRIYDEMGFNPTWTLQAGGQDLISRWTSLGATEEQVLGHQSMRLEHLTKRQKEGSLDGNLSSR